MKTITNTLKTVLVLCLGLTLTSLNAQTTHIVNNNTGTAADFTDLQAAIDAAANGDIIHVQQSSTSYGDIDLNKELTIIGRSHSDASYTSQIGTLNLRNGCSNSTIKGLDIANIFDPFVSGETPGTINDLVIQDNKIASFQNFGNQRTFDNVLIQGNLLGFFSTGANLSNILCTNNIFFSSISLGMVNTLLFTNNIISASPFGNVSISNNTPDLLNISNTIFVTDSFTTRTVNFFGSGTFQVSNCLTYNYGSGLDLNFSTGGNITISSSQENVDPLFTFRDGSSGSIGTVNNSVITFNPSLDDLTLQAGSPFANDGIYEAYNFKPLGTPTGLPSLKIDSYDTTVPKNSDLTVTITAKTN
jgi:hypothetical protein